MLLQPPFGLVLILLGIAYPMLEIALLIKTASVIGFWPTFAIVLATAVIGMRVLQEHGFVVMRRLSEALRSGRTPFQPMIEGGVLFFAGLCLLAPGLITDVIGLLLLIPPVRHLLAVYLHDRVWGLPREEPGPDPKNTGSGPTPGAKELPPEQPASGQRGATDGPIIEGEFERIDERPIDPKRDKRR